MASPVRITVYYDQSQRPSGRGHTNRQKRNAYDNELSRLVPHVIKVVRGRLNNVEAAANAATKTSWPDMTVDLHSYVAPARQSDTLFVEILLNSVGPYETASDDLRTQIAADILSWLGYYARVASYLEINLMFVPMSGMRVLFNGRSLSDSWGEASEPDVGSQVPAS